METKNKKDYEFLVSICNGWCNGTLVFSANNEDEAYEMAIEYVGNKLTEAFPELDIEYTVEIYDTSDYEETIKNCSYCGEKIVLEDNDYEEIDGELFCLDCVKKHFGKCEWCGEYVPSSELAWYGNILCCNGCASNEWMLMEKAINGDD